MILLFIYIAIALGVSFLCSVLEAVLLSVTPSYIAAEEERGHRNDMPFDEIRDCFREIYPYMFDDGTAISGDFAAEAEAENA